MAKNIKRIRRGIKVHAWLTVIFCSIAVSEPFWVPGLTQDDVTHIGIMVLILLVIAIRNQKLLKRLNAYENDKDNYPDAAGNTAA